jgi:hypothetical protein
LKKFYGKPNIIAICLMAFLTTAAAGEEVPPRGDLQRLDIVIAGSGIVSGPGIECTGVCSYFFARGSRVMLHAEPSDEWHFVGWDGCGKEEVCEVVLDRHTTVMAIFVHP